MFERDLEAIGINIKNILLELGLPDPGEVKWQATPLAGQWGQGTNLCFQAAAAEARSGKQVKVPARAQELASLIVAKLPPPPGFARVEADGAYLNFYFDTPAFATRVVDSILTEGADFGRGAAKAERVMVEYAQPNTHHSFHIGHARNALLGESLARLLNFAGFPVIRASYPGDIGLGVVTVMWAYDRFYRGQEPSGVRERGEWLLKIYAEANALLEARPDETPEQRALREQYDLERRDLYRRWDAGDPAARELWAVTRQWSLDELKAILETLDIHIDIFFYESEVDEPSKAIIEELIARGLAEDGRAEGKAVIVKIDEKLGLTKEKYRVAVVLRNDGTSLYLTKDLALAKVKFEQYHVDRSIYVVDFRQNLHFQQVFKILELWGFPQASKCHHLSYGYVTLPEGAMSSRRGRVVIFQEVVDEAARRVQQAIADKNPDLPAEQRALVARQVGLGALTYALLSVDNVKDIVYEADTALALEGKTGPYIQNAHVRANSILKKGGLPAEASYGYALHPLETELIEQLTRFPAAVQLAAADYKPLHMANYVYELAKTFHAFYHEAPVLQADDPAVRAARLRLVAAVRQTIANALRLLDIQAPEVM